MIGNNVKRENFVSDFAKFTPFPEKFGVYLKWIPQIHGKPHFLVVAVLQLGTDYQDLININKPFAVFGLV
jgi:hypothetical protein